MTQQICVAALGDSMTNSAGDGCPRLTQALQAAYPEITFDVHNYGVGGTRVGYGLWRLTHDYEHEGKQFPALVKIKPDLVIVESFAYNNGSDAFDRGGLEHFRDMHHKVIETLRCETNAQLLFLVTIAPDKDRFLESVPSFFNTPISIRRWMAEDREVYLKEGIKIAAEHHLPLVNVYQASLDAAADGRPLSTFIDQNDWIHPNDAGHQLTAECIVKTLQTESFFDESASPSSCL